MSTATTAPKAGAEQDNDELEALFDSIAAAQQPEDQSDPHEGEDVVAQVGHLTRHLHDALSQLGYDRLIADAAEAFPDTRERLNYVATMTEQAATRCLTAIEVARPVQDELAASAASLSKDWERLFKEELSAEEFKSLAKRTRGFLDQVPAAVTKTNAQLTEIMMAQDFQDLTGQVIKKVTDVAQDVERQLLKLLVEHAPSDKRAAVRSAGLLNGPVIDSTGRNDVVTSQAQVDELLESLGF